LLDNPRNSVDDCERVVSRFCRFSHEHTIERIVVPKGPDVGCGYAGMVTDEAFRVVLVDDHDVVRAGLRSLFDGEVALTVVGEAATAEDALRRVGLDEPDIVVMDVRLPDGSGIDACREIRRQWPETKVLILTSYAFDDALMEAFDAGAAGYVLKRVDAAGLVDAVLKVGNGELLFGEVLDAAVAARLRSDGEISSKLDLLSEQERKVLDLLMVGRSNKQIASEMFLSDKTVKNYVSHILAKLDVASRTEAAAYAGDVSDRGTGTYPAEDWDRN
jgi:two-component system response regulator DevR